ncbi:GNAT family N-acetyltransferase [Vibrio panuliri]|uniref:GNAT family N-acetyltransferase n=1 Tax=Vibrio panuliri TaxID=1381081 RepID=A0ABX3FME1_9VIBR|nr:GNAT family N-acetyltransferase [Vibrio panuliri]KAB1458070.1 GNAT family N-acetyltransferase [Vibrio panuliri]OLQ95112.1 GNAT family N-acetyltransferase [Vibrio panuliri]
MDTKLRAFLPADYHQLITWIDSDELNYLWGGPAFSFPLTSAQLRAHYDNPDIHAFMFVVDQVNAGYIELYQESLNSFRICRVFVATDFRGQKLSAVLLNQLIEKAQSEFHATSLSLAVFSHNHVAKCCYQSLGFRTTAIKQGIRHYQGKAWDLEIMQKNTLK